MPRKAKIPSLNPVDTHQMDQLGKPASGQCRSRGIFVLYEWSVELL